MVKKLFKHEFLAYMRALLPMHLIMLGIAALTRFVYIFEEDSTMFNIIGTSSIVALVVSCLVCLVLSSVNIITRFYKNMFTHEGYLSFTLPVTVEQHIFVKLVTGIAIIFANILFIVVGVCIATAGELTVELFKAMFWLLDMAGEEIGGHFWLFLLELLVLFIEALAVEILLFYSCISIGQLSNKNRIILAISPKDTPRSSESKRRSVIIDIAEFSIPHIIPSATVPIQKAGERRAILQSIRRSFFRI